MSITRKALVCAPLAALAIALGGGAASAGGWHDDDPGGHGCVLKDGKPGVYKYQHSKNGRHHFHCVPKR
ncbi:hypothetical protein GOARA_043_00260 [Gordonia araii NBRC 100433]|uniref:Uncharacterized protein n=1 Tax=Gordonia araii NBRC 100433 TaxID=1073574 RepID=G7H191_9ACTN|nr:hypothetical protein [Gordonia araii]NNG96761.1 hypothetical protein [Gordonia araii NBRC 100433]GAB09551.1 hypothetical protein GOARA_043_00260 [Gordonia araii NBRC 100433]